MYYATVSFGSALFLVVALRRLAAHYGLLDRPSNRKTHLGAVPLIGGLAIGTAFLTASFLEGSPSLPFVMG
ncbi:MAG: hypothetical protein ABI619_13610, partial [Betaproteobacteria bacterium]